MRWPSVARRIALACLGLWTLAFTGAAFAQQAAASSPAVDGEGAALLARDYSQGENAVNARQARMQSALERLRSADAKSGQKACLCHDEAFGICLNCRFGVVGDWRNPFDGSSGLAGAIRLTDESGYLWFSDPGNMEIPLKILDGCGSGSPSTRSWWVFSAGLTNLGVHILTEDFETGNQKEYINPAGQTFNTIIDQQTPFGCP
jgi:hypothetical protein